MKKMAKVFISLLLVTLFQLILTEELIDFTDNYDQPSTTSLPLTSTHSPLTSTSNGTGFTPPHDLHTRPWFVTKPRSWATSTTPSPWRTTGRPWQTTAWPWRTTGRYDPYRTTARYDYRTTNRYWNGTRGSTSRPDYVRINGDDQPTIDVEPYAKTFEKRLKAAMAKEGHKLIKTNGTASSTWWSERRGLYNVSYDDTMIYGLENLEINPTIGYIVDHNLIAVNGSLDIQHPFVTTKVTAMVNSTNDGEDGQELSFKVSSFADRKLKIYFSVLVSTKWDNMIIQRLSYDEYDYRYNYRYNDYQRNRPVFNPVVDCTIDIENYEICSNIEEFVKSHFNSVPDKILNLIKVIASNVKPEIK